MTAAFVATALVVVVAAVAGWYLRSVRGRPRSVGSDVARFRASLDALAPSGNERPPSAGGTMEGLPDAEG